MSLTNQLSKCSCVITLGKVERPYKIFKKLCGEIVSYASTYALILHDCDVLADGSLVTPHIHIVFTLPKRKRQSTIINDLCAFTGVVPFAVSVRKLNSFDAAFRYLIHFDNPEKYQYPVDDIVTNLSIDERDLIFSESHTDFDLEYVWSVCEKADSLKDIIKTLGIGTYQHYRMTIKDIIEQIVLLREKAAAERSRHNGKR